ncbi:PucR family transcriptional regulator [Nocardia sp. NPDC004068]|uniref:PucR family transcriptional regulator n=1 Tax=Nocardia sp. NPDC004068 TaxID=3364303 RepID=UPI0036BE885E
MAESARPVDVPPTLAGHHVTSPLRDVRTLSRKMVGHFLDTVVACRTMPTDAISGDFTATTRLCLELAVAMFDGADTGEQIARLEDAAAGWAREGIPLGVIHHAVHEGFRLGVDLVQAHLTAADLEDIKLASRRQIDVLEIITATISDAYVRELRAAAGEHHHAAHTLITALLSGHSTSTMARECGIDIAPSYHVVALALPPHPDEHDPTLDGRVVARRKLRRVQAALAARCGEAVLSLLSVDGGTILVPTTSVADAELDEFVEALSAAAGVAVTATVVGAAPEGVPEAANQAHQLLDTVQHLRTRPGLHRLDDLAVEYQITRPGPGREVLGALLAPLDAHPELLQTLTRHLANNLNRRLTARDLHVHANTVDYRLKRIAQLTGFDPSTPGGLWYLRSAIVARTYTTNRARDARGRGTVRGPNRGAKSS